MTTEQILASMEQLANDSLNNVTTPPTMRSIAELVLLFVALERAKAKP